MSDSCTSGSTGTWTSTGRIVLPHGVSDELLVLPDGESIDPVALQKIGELVHGGATVLGPRPSRSTGFAGHPECDDEVRSVADELWGEIDGERITEHRFGEGRIVQGRSVLEVLAGCGLRAIG